MVWADDFLQIGYIESKSIVIRRQSANAEFNSVPTNLPGVLQICYVGVCHKNSRGNQGIHKHLEGNRYAA
jgi:hypothetical protein